MNKVNPSENTKPKLKRERMTGLWRKENQYGEYWSGKLADGTMVVLSYPHPEAIARAEAEGKEPPALILSRLVPEEG